MQYCSRSFADTVATRSTYFLGSQSQALRRVLASATSSRTADPALHVGDYEAADPALTTGDPQGTKNVAKEKPAVDEQHTPVAKPPSCSGKEKGTELLAPPNKPSYPNASSPRLESTGVNLQPSTNYNQKRHYHATTAATADSSNNLSLHNLEKVSCAGLDGTPWPSDKEKEQTDRDREEKERVDDERDYYKHHKASPLSEIEFADTRKPITRAMDATADSVSEYGAGKDVIGWRPEQLDTAEEALARAARIWKENAIRGDPDAPHSRVLRALRGESF